MIDTPPLEPPKTGAQWIRLYKAGIKAWLEGQPREPPGKLIEEEKEIWLEGYDR